MEKKSYDYDLDAIFGNLGGQRAEQVNPTPKAKENTVESAPTKAKKTSPETTAKQTQETMKKNTPQVDAPAYGKQKIVNGTIKRCYNMPPILDKALKRRQINDGLNLSLNDHFLSAMTAYLASEVKALRAEGYDFTPEQLIMLAQAGIDI